MSFTIQPSFFIQRLLEKRTMVHSADKKSSFPALTRDQKYLIKKLLQLTEATCLDEEMTIFIKKLIDFLLSKDMSWLNVTQINVSKISNPFTDQSSKYLKDQAEDKMVTSSTQPVFQTNIEELLRQMKIQERSRSIRDLFPNKKIIFCKENSHAAHVLYILAAFSKLLLQNPCWINQLVLIQVCSSQVPSEELEAIPELVRQINQLCGNTEFVPVHFYHQEIDQDELLAYTSAANLSLCLNEPFVVEQCLPSNGVLIKDPSNITQLTESILDALMKSIPIV